MGLIENFKKLGYRFTSAQHKPKMTKREAVMQIHAWLCQADLGEPVSAVQKFEKINVSQYTDEQVSRILNGIKAVVNEYSRTTQ